MRPAPAPYTAWRPAAASILSTALLPFLPQSFAAPLPPASTPSPTRPIPPSSPRDPLLSIFTDSTIWIALFSSAAFFALAFRSFEAARPGRARFSRVDVFVSALGVLMVVAGFGADVAGAHPVADSDTATAMATSPDPVSTLATFWLVTSATAVLTAVIFALTTSLYGGRLGPRLPRPDVLVSTLGLLIIVAGFCFDVVGAHPVVTLTNSSTSTGVLLVSPATTNDATRVQKYLMPIPLTPVPPTATCRDSVPCSAAAALSVPSAWGVSGSTCILLTALFGFWMALPQARRGRHADFLFRLTTTVLLVAGFMGTTTTAQLLLPSTGGPLASLLAPLTATTTSITGPDPTSAAITTTTATPESSPAKRPGRSCLRMLMTMDGTATLVPGDRCLDPKTYGLSGAVPRTSGPSVWLVVVVLVVLLGVVVGAVKGAGVGAYGVVPGSTAEVASITVPPAVGESVRADSPSVGLIKRRSRGTTQTQAAPTSQKLAEVSQSWHRAVKPVPPYTTTFATLEPGLVNPHGPSNPGATRLGILLALLILAACLVPVAFASPIPSASTVTDVTAALPDQDSDIEVPEQGSSTASAGIGKPSPVLIALVVAGFVGLVVGGGRIYGVVPGSPTQPSTQTRDAQSESVSPTGSGVAATATAYEGVFKRKHKRETPYKRLAFRDVLESTAVVASTTASSPVEAGLVTPGGTKNPGALSLAVLVLAIVLAVGMVPAAFAVPVHGPVAWAALTLDRPLARS